MIFTRKQLCEFIANQFDQENFADYLLSKMNERQIIKDFETASGRKVQRFGIDKYVLA